MRTRNKVAAFVAVLAMMAGMFVATAQVAQAGTLYNCNQFYSNGTYRAFGASSSWKSGGDIHVDSSTKGSRTTDTWCHYRNGYSVATYTKLQIWDGSKWSTLSSDGWRTNTAGFIYGKTSFGDFSPGLRLYRAITRHALGVGGAWQYSPTTYTQFVM
jgi:hypothetical protein